MCVIRWPTSMCLTRVQENMMAQLMIIQNDQAEGKLSVRSQSANELQYLINFKQSINFAMTKTMQYTLDFVFVSLANITR